MLLNETIQVPSFHFRDKACVQKGERKQTNKQIKHPTTLKLILQEVGIQVLYLNGSIYKDIGDANNPCYMRSAMS